MEHGALVIVHWTKTGEINMKFTIGTKENLIGLMDNWSPSMGDALSYARQLFPNSYKAIDSAVNDIKIKELPGDKELFFTITIFIHFSKLQPETPKVEAVRRVKRGYTGAINIYKDDLVSAEKELPIETIKATIVSRLNKQIEFLLSRKDIQE